MISYKEKTNSSDMECMKISLTDDIVEYLNGNDTKVIDLNGVFDVLEYNIDMDEEEVDVNFIQLIYVYLISTKSVEQQYWLDIFSNGKDWLIKLVANLIPMSIHELVLIKDSGVVGDIMSNNKDINMDDIDDVLNDNENLGSYHKRLYEEYIEYQLENGI